MADRSAKPAAARPRVCVVSAVAPYPVDAGKKVVLAGLLEYLATRFGPENVHYVLVGAGGPVDEQRLPAVLHRIPGPGRRDVSRALLLRVVSGRASLQEAFLHSRTVAADVHRTLAAIGADVEVYDTVRLGQYVDQGAAPRRVLYLDDLFSERYTTMLAAARRFRDVEIDALGNFRVHIPARLRAVAERARVQRMLLRWERRLVRRSEDRAVGRFATSLLVNAREATTLARRTGSDRVRAIPPLVRTSGAAGARRPSASPVFVFLGLLSLPHNDDGLRSFLVETWPALLGQVPDARLLVVGRDPRASLAATIAARAGSVELAGYVDDLDGVLSTATALVNPLRFGSGVKIKVIEALSRGLPVVSTPVGADGIDQGPEHGIWVARDAAEFVAHLRALVDPAANERSSRGAVRHHARVYSREAAFRSYDASILTPALRERTG